MRQVWRSALLVSGAVAVLLVAFAGGASAQEGSYRLSQRATVSQRIGKAKVSLDYSRPLMRGRSDVFGKVVLWGELWTPGANEATVLEVSDTVALDGHRVAPGRWSMWVIPSQVGPWELVLDPRDSLFHTERPKPAGNQVRFPLTVKQDAPFVEALAWTFPALHDARAELRLNWGSVEIPIEVRAQSLKPPVAVAAAEAAAYEGVWRVQYEPDPQTGKRQPPMRLTISRDEHGVLAATMAPSPAADAKAAAAKDGKSGEPVKPAAGQAAALTPQEQERAEAVRKLAELEAGAWTYVLVPRAAGIFAMGWMDQGELTETYNVFHEFELKDGRALSLVVRNDKDQVVGRATRER